MKGGETKLAWGLTKLDPVKSNYMLENHKSQCDLLGNTTLDETIENQQERLFFDIGYLLGLLDGDGSYQFGRKGRSKKYTIYEPKITLFNNNVFIIQKMINILDRLKIAFQVYAPKIHGKEKSQTYRISISGIKRVKRFTDLILKFEFGKKERAIILNKYCKLRLSIPYGDREKYVEEEKIYFNKLKKLNQQFRKGTKSPETIRLTSQEESEDIVRTYAEKVRVRWKHSNPCFN